MAARVFLTLCVVLLTATPAHAAHPLITDDTGTQGRGLWQVELTSEYSSHRERERGQDIEEDAVEVTTVLSYGITDRIDALLEVPYIWYRFEVDGSDSHEHGISDVTGAVKWRALDLGDLSFAVKPAIGLPTGDENKGLGNGKLSYGITLIATKERGPMSIHANIGYTRNEYRLDEDETDLRNDVWHISLATEYGATASTRLVGNIGMESSDEKAEATPPVFALGGLIYSVAENFDIDVGMKIGLTKAEADFSLLAGLAWRP